jgi:hypothetical protein
LFSISVVGPVLRRAERSDRWFLNGAADFETKRFAGEAFERCGVARRRPQFELGVAAGPNLQQVVVAAIVELDAADALRVAAVEALGEAENRG